MGKERGKSSNNGLQPLWWWGGMGLALLFGLTWYEVPLVSSQGMMVRAHFQEGNVPDHPSDAAWETVSPSTSLKRANHYAARLARAECTGVIYPVDPQWQRSGILNGMAGCHGQ